MKRNTLLLCMGFRLRVTRDPKLGRTLLLPSSTRSGFLRVVLFLGGQGPPFIPQEDTTCTASTILLSGGDPPYLDWNSTRAFAWKLNHSLSLSGAQRRPSPDTGDNPVIPSLIGEDLWWPPSE